LITFWKDEYKTFENTMKSKSKRKERVKNIDGNEEFYSQKVVAGHLRTQFHFSGKVPFFLARCARSARSATFLF